MPFAGSTAAPPHSAPPSNPGKMMVPSRLGGMKGMCGRTFTNVSMTALRDSGEMSVISSAENNWRVNGAGFKGNGWVGQVDSPCKSDGGTDFSSMGNNDSPVSRLNTKTWPDLVTCATASMVLPLRRTVNKVGGAGGSRSHKS